MPRQVESHFDFWYLVSTAIQPSISEFYEDFAEGESPSDRGMPSSLKLWFALDAKPQKLRGDADEQLDVYHLGKDDGKTQ